MGFWNWVGKPTYAPGDPETLKMRKAFFFLITLILVTVCFVMMVMEYSISLASRVFHFVHLAMTSTVIFYMVITKRCDALFAEVAIISANIVIFSEDFRTYGAVDLWSYAVVGMDLMLLCSCRRRAINLFYGVSLVYITFRTLEESVEMGIYDQLPDMSSVSRCPERKGMHTGAYALLNRLTVISLDFFMTRRFCYGMQHEQDIMRATIEAAQQLASDFVRYDLHAAETTLRAVPRGDLQAAFSQLLSNLRSYRPYLPDALFPAGYGSLHGMIFRPPPDGHVAIAFTDIQMSTPIWEVTPHGMRIAMVIHNRIMRDCLAAANGYEVKTIGDAFMAAFDTALDACRFCLTAQQQLYDSPDWPREILDTQICAPVPGKWNGLRVRMGVHFGEAEMQVNPVIGRADYFGQNVNIAARVEGVAQGGTVAVTADVLKQIGPVGLESLGNPARKALGAVELKGVGDPIDITLIVPQSLSGRVAQESAPSLLEVQDLEWTVSTSTSRVMEVTCSHLDSRMLRAAGTAGWVRVDYSFLNGSTEPLPHVNDVISTVVDCVERTEGKIASVSNSAILITWNVMQRCSYHTSQAARFAGTLKKVSKGHSFAEHTNVGLCSGEMLKGLAGTADQRFVMVIGQCIELSGFLAAAASTLPTFALVGAVPGHVPLAHDPSLSSAVRCVDIWEVWNGTVDVFELAVDRVGRRWLLDDDSRSGWSDHYATAFETRNIPLLQAIGRDDPVALKVARLIATGSHFPTPMTSCVDIRSLAAV